MSEEPVRLQLSRTKGFDLQALSVATNGLPAVNVARPTVFGNPFTVQGAADAYDCRRPSAHSHAVRMFCEWLELPNDHETFRPMYVHEGLQKQHADIHRRLPELRGKNLACFCRPDYACHADVLLMFANGPLSTTQGGEAP